MTERYFHLLKAVMNRYPAVQADVQLQEFIDACTYYYNKGDTIMPISGRGVAKRSAEDPDEQEEFSNAIYIADLKDDDKYFALLLIRGDSNRALPGFVNLKDQSISVAATDDDEAVPGTSCHIIISKEKIAMTGAGHHHRTAMERSIGISRLLAREYFTALLRQFADDFPDRYIAEKTQKKKKAKTETINYRPTIRFDPQENGRLKDDLKNGLIGGFKLKRGHTEFKGEASEPKVNNLDIELRAEIVPTENFSQVQALVNRVKEAVKKVDFEGVQLQLVDEDGEHVAGPRPIKLEDFENSDMRYCKKVSMTGITQDIPEIVDLIHKEILTSALNVIASKSHWK